MDLFGDGFHTTFVNFTTTNHGQESSSSQFHQPNCSSEVVSVYSETCSLDVSMLTKDDGHPLLPWESYWILNWGGETYIGDFFSKLSVAHGVVTSTEKLVDYSVPGKDGNKCHECPHPPKFNANIPPGVCESSAVAKPCPPPAGPAPKPEPPYLVYINMYDELSNGFLDESGDWSDYFHTQELIGTGGEYKELQAPILVPHVLAYPKYYLMTKDRQKLINPPKSICAQNRGTEFCQEALPWSGHFIFRFAGIEPRDPADVATWEFCGISGGINEEFEFIMREGVCHPLTSKLTAAAHCEHGFETAISMNGAFTVSGEAGGSWSVPGNTRAGIISLAGVLVGALVAVLVATSVVKRRNGESVELNFGLPAFGAGVEAHAQLPGDSEHAVERNTQLEEAPVQPSSAMRGEIDL
jgi:hypothetical protein